MSTPTTSNQRPAWTGIPLKDRTESMIRDALEGYPAETVQQFINLHAYASREHVGMTALAHRAGIGSSILSQSYSGTYKGDVNAIAERIAQFFWRLEQQEKYGGIRKFVMTNLAKALFAVFEKTRVIRRIQIIQSPEQLGKTTIAREYTRQNNSGRTVYAKLRGGSRNACSDFIREMAVALDIPHTINLCEIKLRIRHQLHSCDLVIIDEAHLADSWTIRNQAEFWDYIRTDIHSDGDRGVAIISTNHDMLGGLKRLRQHGYNIGQLLGRTRNETIVIDPAGDITEHDVFMLTARYYNPGDDAIAVLLDIASRPGLGHFGLLNDILNEAWTTAKADHKQLTDKAVVDQARKTLKQLSNNKDLYK
jgi:DNA transposition AAA+ family ATPase